MHEMCQEEQKKKRTISSLAENIYWKEDALDVDIQAVCQEFVGFLIFFKPKTTLKWRLITGNSL